METESPKLLTARQLARELNVKARTIGRWRIEGRIPFWGANKRTFRYDPDAVRDALMHGVAVEREVDDGRQTGDPITH